MLRRMKSMYKNFIEQLKIFRLQKKEKNKFNDKRKKEIYNSVSLTKEEKKNIDFLFKRNYGKKISYIWHKYYTAYTGKFDQNYFPELLYIPRFEYYMNFNKAYCSVFEDKNILPLIASNINVKTPNTIVSCSYGIYMDKYNNIKTKEEIIKIMNNFGSCFAKPSINSGSGNGCILLEFKKGIDNYSKKRCRDIIEYLGDNFVIQEVIKCHSSLSKIYPQSVNTFRIISYRWKDNIFTTPTILRIGRNGKYLDNAYAGGMFIAIDDDGVLHEKAFTEFNEQFCFHPDTYLKFKNYKIDLFPTVLEAAKKMHFSLPQIGVINWDFTIDEDGKPVLIEANITGGSIWLPQMAHGIGAFGDKTEEILAWLKIVEKVKVEDRYKYKFGNICNKKNGGDIDEKKESHV